MNHYSYCIFHLFEVFVKLTGTQMQNVGSPKLIGLEWANSRKCMCVWMIVQGGKGPNDLQDKYLQILDL